MTIANSPVPDGDGGDGDAGGESVGDEDGGLALGVNEDPLTRADGDSENVLGDF